MAGADQAFEALTDCGGCKVEAAVVELVSVQSGRGVVLESRCRLCLREERGGASIHQGERFEGDVGAARAALTRWGLAEGDDEPERFVLAHFGGLDLEAAALALSRGERLETSFDAIAWLFPGVGAVGGRDAEERARESAAPAAAPRRAPSLRPRASDPDLEDRKTLEYVSRVDAGVPMVRSSVAPLIPATIESIPPHKHPLRVAARALSSVMLADGRLDPQGRVLLDQTLASWGHPPIRNDDIAIWRPHDLGWPDDANRVVEAMCRLAYADGERDATEWRVVREYARAWGVSLDAVEALGTKLELEHQRGLRRLMSSITQLFVR